MRCSVLCMYVLVLLCVITCCVKAPVVFSIIPFLVQSLILRRRGMSASYLLLGAGNYFNLKTKTVMQEPAGSEARRGKTRQGEARRGKARQGEARRGEARQDEGQGRKGVMKIKQPDPLPGAEKGGTR